VPKLGDFLGEKWPWILVIAGGIVLGLVGLAVAIGFASSRTNTQNGAIPPSGGLLGTIDALL